MCTHRWRCAFSCLCVLSADMWFSQYLSSVVFTLHDARHLIIVIFPVHQSISGLCSMSHVCPRIIIVQPMLVIWNVACFQFDSNCIPNMSPALQVLFLIVLVMQLFETTYWLPNLNTTQYSLVTFKVSMTLAIFNVFLKRTSFL